MAFPWGTILGGVISAGSSLIGGAMNNAATANLNRKNRKWHAAEQRKGEKRAEKRQIAAEKRETQRFKKFTDPAWIRRRAEKAGFNPLLFTGQASGYGGVGGGAAGYSQGAPAFSSLSDNGIAGAGSALAAGFASLDEANAEAEAKAAQLSAIEMENQRLREVAENARFRQTNPPFLEARGPTGGFANGYFFNTTDDARAVARTTDGMNPLDPGVSVDEKERFMTHEGGLPGDLSVHHSVQPNGRIWSDSRPGYGQRREDAQGELFGAFSSAGHSVVDLGHNMSGHMYHPGREAWVTLDNQGEIMEVDDGRANPLINWAFGSDGPGGNKGALGKAGDKAKDALEWLYQPWHLGDIFQ